MRLKKFNESVGKLDIFTDEKSLHTLLSPLKKWGPFATDISYKIFAITASGDLMPIGDSVKCNFSNKYWADRIKTYETFKIASGIIIDIRHKFFEVLVSDEQRVGRKFATFTEDYYKLTEDIERIKYDVEDMMFTLTMHMSLEPSKDGSKDSQISLMILNGDYK